MLISAMVTKVKAEGGIDAPDDTVKGWLHDRIERLIVAAKWRRVETELGVTVADQDAYVTPTNVVDVMAVTVDDEPYDLASVEEIWKLKRGTAWLRGAGGVFAPYYSDDGTAEGLRLYPAPAADGLSIDALAAVKPPQTADDAEPPFPSDLHHGAWEGAIADGLALMDERLNESSFYEAKFEAVASELERRRKSLVGSGPVQIRVTSY